MLLETQPMNLKFYRRNEWKEFRNSVIEFDGRKCSVCNRTDKEVKLQVHHKYYVIGRLPWEYPTKDCETLCMGCHAREHGILQPNYGWEYMGDEDLGEKNGTCQNCGASLRYNYIIYHKDWGTLEVGSECCNNLTDTDIASNNKDSKTKYLGRLKRFVKSKRWVNNALESRIKTVGLNISIKNIDELYHISINNVKGKKTFADLDEGKIEVFELIESGDLITFFKKNFLFKIQKGTVLTSHNYKHMIFYIKRINETSFVGCKFSNSEPDYYIRLMTFLVSSVEENYEDPGLSNFYYIKPEIFYLKEYRPFFVISKFNSTAINSIITLIKDESSTFYRKHLKRKSNSA